MRQIPELVEAIRQIALERLTLPLVQASQGDTLKVIVHGLEALAAVEDRTDFETEVLRDLCDLCLGARFTHQRADGSIIASDVIAAATLATLPPRPIREADITTLGVAALVEGNAPSVTPLIDLAD
jgi:hypothetical protein